MNKAYENAAKALEDRQRDDMLIAVQLNLQGQRVKLVEKSSAPQKRDARWSASPESIRNAEPWLRATRRSMIAATEIATAR